ncbi:MAG: hypothetical protein AOA66_1187 [Candidatus Bathyarchaeota archaeon BA2]|nr:MAG: hypothetical protein AOA66_1187 [Candidatus Bathyarchaeota archaeon BA2]
MKLNYIGIVATVLAFVSLALHGGKRQFHKQYWVSHIHFRFRGILWDLRLQEPYHMHGQSPYGAVMRH